ncbi:Annexin [Hexamita inflata]|uniref:Annexin n=1 Tax=Hexamita inflata TaxID=28002 RepID=A0AA86NNZ9_9EUKA|nr:Annexin [Hexamita inflata]
MSQENNELSQDQLKTNPSAERQQKQPTDTRKTSIYSQTRNGSLPQLAVKERQSRPEIQPNKNAEEIILKDRIPKKIQQLNDCNELRRELLSLLQQEKQMEFKIRREEDRIKRSGQQLVEENERPNEDILTEKRNQKFRLEKQIESIKQKTQQIQLTDLTIEKIKYEKQAEMIHDQIQLAQNPELVRDLIEFKLNEMTKNNLQSAIDSTTKAKQPLFQTILNQLQIETAQLQTKLDQKLHYRKTKFLEVKQTMNCIDEAIRADYQKRYDDLTVIMMQDHPELTTINDNPDQIEQLLEREKTEHKNESKEKITHKSEIPVHKQEKQEEPEEKIEIKQEEHKKEIKPKQNKKEPEHHEEEKIQIEQKENTGTAEQQLEIINECDSLHENNSEDDILHVALKHNHIQRAAIATAYKQKFNTSLESEIKGSILNKDLENLCTGLFANRAVFWAQEINEAINKNNEQHIAYLILTLNREEKIEVQTKFKELFGNDMDIAVINALGQHDWQKLVKAWLKQNKDESSPEQHAEALHNAVLKSGVDEDAFINILSAKPAKFREVAQLFEEKHNKPLREVIKAEFGGDAEFAFTLAHDVLMSRADAAAFLVYTATKGSGTKDQMLVNTTILFSEFAKDQVQGAYAKFGDMTKDLKGDLAGKYEDAVLTLWGLK